MSRVPWDNTSLTQYVSDTPTSSTTFSLTADRLLIVDDSNQIRSSLVANIIKACNMCERPYRIVQVVGATLSEVAASDNVESRRPLVIYTASSPRNALAVLKLPEVQRLIIVSDIMMPGDSEVGLVGLLAALAERRLPTSLTFASSERQNRYYVAEVLQSGKASFTEKGGAAWAELPFKLVEDTARLQYQVITQADFDRAHTRSAARDQVVTAIVEVHKTTQRDQVSFWQRLAFWNWKKNPPVDRF